MTLEKLAACCKSAEETINALSSKWRAYPRKLTILPGGKVVALWEDPTRKDFGMGYRYRGVLVGPDGSVIDWNT